jgi:hypothetical protein
MKIDVPVFNEDGSVQYVQTMSPDEAQAVLQFALNFLVTSGLAINYALVKSNKGDNEQVDPAKMN